MKIERMTVGTHYLQYRQSTMEPYDYVWIIYNGDTYVGDGMFIQRPEWRGKMGIPQPLPKNWVAVV